MIGENLQTAFVQLASEEGVEMDPWDELEQWEQNVWNLLAQRAVHLREDTANQMKEMAEATGTDVHTLANAVINYAYRVQYKAGHNMNQEPHKPMREDDVANWLKNQRDVRRDQPGWLVVDDILDDYRLHADTGQPLFVKVSDYPGETPE